MESFSSESALIGVGCICAGHLIAQHYRIRSSAQAAALVVPKRGAKPKRYPLLFLPGSIFRLVPSYLHYLSRLANGYPASRGAPCSGNLLQVAQLYHLSLTLSSIRSNIMCVTL